MTEMTIEQEIQAKANKATRVTPADIEAEITAEYSTTLDKALAGCPKSCSLMSQLPPWTRR